MKTLPSAFHTIVLGGLSVGVLDGIAASVNAAVRGVSPVRVWQYVTSSVLGSESFTGGMATMALGIVFHFLIAFGVATAFYLLARIFPILLRRAVLAGVIFGVVVYFAMSYVIVPLTAVKQGAFTWNGLITGILIHMLFVGLPVALIAKRYAK